MARGFYRALLRLLPRRRRDRYGDDMLDLFEQLQRDQHQRRRGAGFWWSLREIAGIARFLVREWLAALRDAVGGSPGVSTELRWVWRGVRSRGWSAPLVVVLLAGAIGATAVTFAVADALVFNPVPFPDAERVVTIEQRLGAQGARGRAVAADHHDAWSRQRDLFSAVGGHLRKGGVFLRDADSSIRIETSDITLEFLDVLGVAPRWGRGFTRGDLAADDVYAALVSERFARRRFGQPDGALGQRIEATGRPVVIVGVMDDTFAFPGSGVDLWRLMDLRGPLTSNFGAVGIMARVTAGVPIEAVPHLTAARAATIGDMLGIPEYTAGTQQFFVTPPSLAEARRDGQRMLLLLLGAGASLLLIASANVASLEFAHAIRRLHAGAIRRALGASPGLLVRIAGLEGLVLTGAAFGLSVGVATLVLGLAEPHFPRAFAQSGYNPIDIDGRTLTFAAASAALAWLFISLPTALFTGAPRALGTERQATPARRARLRHQLTVVQVALAVALVIVGSMYGRTYRALLALDKGFDSTGVATVTASLPVNYFDSPQERERVTTELVDEVRNLSGVLAASRWSPPPSTGNSPTRTEIWIDGRQVMEKGLLAVSPIDLGYFDLVGLPLLAGRLPRAGEPPTNIVVPESFARRFWNDGQALGGTVRHPMNRTELTVIGVVGDFRRHATRMPNDEDSLFAYHMWSPSPPDQERGPDRPERAFVDSGGSYMVLTIAVRVASPDVLPIVRAAVQRVDPRLAVTTSLVDDEYARQNAHILLASRSVGIFSLVSFAIALAGLYGVVAFVVASRTREIGIRMALGAAASDIRHMVLAAAWRMVVSGVLAGVALAFVVARWIESQLFGISPTDPVTYAVVASIISLAAMAATWLPARRAASVDPAITLRAE